MGFLLLALTIDGCYFVFNKERRKKESEIENKITAIYSQSKKEKSHIQKRKIRKNSTIRIIQTCGQLMNIGEKENNKDTGVKIYTTI